MTRRRIGFGLAGVVAMALAVSLTPTIRDAMATVMFATGGMLLAFFFGVPLVTAADTGHPISHLLSAFADRQHAMVSRIRGRLLNTLIGVAADVVLDPDRARQLVEEVIEMGAARWRGAVDEQLDRFLLCSVVYRGLGDSRSDPPVAADDPRSLLRARPRWDRAVIALRRHGFLDQEIASILGCRLTDLPPVEPPMAARS